MVMTDCNLELKFIDYSIDNYVDLFTIMIQKGKRNFLLCGESKKVLLFLEKTKYIIRTNTINVFTSSEVSINQDAYSEYISTDKEYDVKCMDTIFIFINDGELLSEKLLEFVNLRECTICAPITEKYFKNRFIFVICVPKAGAHMLLKLIHEFGFHGPRDTSDIKKDGSYYFVNNKDQHTEITHLMQLNARQLEAIFSQPLIFLYRDPRDIAVSLYHFLTKPREQFLRRSGALQIHPLNPYFMSLSSDSERLLKVIKGAPILNNINDFVMPYAGWLEMPNVIPIKFEDLVGPKGDGSYEKQLNTIWKLQLMLHIPGRPLDFAKKAFDDTSPTFRRGKIGSYLDEFSEEHINLFKSLPNTFMEKYGFNNDVKVIKPLILWFLETPCPGKASLAEVFAKEMMFSQSTSVICINGEEEIKDYYRDINTSPRNNSKYLVGRAYDIIKNGCNNSIVIISSIYPYSWCYEIKDIESSLVQVNCLPAVMEEDNKSILLEHSRKRKIRNCLGTGKKITTRDINVENDNFGKKRCVQLIIDDLEEMGYIKVIRAREFSKKLQYFATYKVVDNEVELMMLPPLLVEEDYKNYNIVSYNDIYYALNRDIGSIDLADVDLNVFAENSDCLIGESVEYVKQQIDEVLCVKKNS